MLYDLQAEMAQLKDIFKLNMQLEGKRLLMEEQEKRIMAKAKKDAFFKGLLIKAKNHRMTPRIAVPPAHPLQNLIQTIPATKHQCQLSKRALM